MMTKKAYLYFAKSETEKPIVYHLVKDYDLRINIFRAKVTPQEEGYLSLEITGAEEKIDAAFDYLRSLGVEINVGNKGVFWDKDRCTHCGNCLVHCPTRALDLVDPGTREVGFDEDRCVECLACISNCPHDACSSRF